MRAALTSQQRLALRGLVNVLVGAVVLLCLLVMLTACTNRARDTSKAILDAQTPGTATGAGATLTSPGNSATPTTQNATRRIAYYPPQSAPQPARVESATPLKVESPSATPVIRTDSPASGPSTFTVQPSTLPAPPAPYWLEEKTETTIGQHQDASAIMRAAATLQGWGTIKWLGLLAIVGGIAGLLWAAGHDQGYPLVCWKFIGAGLVLVVLGDHPWSLVALIVPIGFYLAQKYNLARLFL